jgi:hypothetical protein
MGLVLVVGAVLLVWFASRRALGWGLGATIGVGYAYGIVRANFLDGFSHFVFDGAVIALYAATFTRATAMDSLARVPALRDWTAALVGWPIIVLAFGPILGTQHMLIQIVGLRSTIFFLPALLVGALATRDDWTRVAWSVAVLNVAALGLGIAEYIFGIERFFPANSVTEIMYRSFDVAGGHHRIPSFFSSAHAYGGTMTFTSPLVLWLVSDPSRSRTARLLALAALAATVGGTFLCGARAPVAQLILVIAILVASQRVSMPNLLAILVVGTIVGYFVAEDERLQRVATLRDLDAVERRIGSSVNMRFLEVISEYPLGTGLASAAGTSVPFFLSSLAVPQIGLENEYSRLAVELGLPGLALWLVFLYWALWTRRPRGRDASVETIDVAGWGVAAVVWSTAFTGTGTLLAIPGTVVLLALMGAYLATGPSPAPSAPMPAAPRPVRRHV